MQKIEYVGVDKLKNHPDNPRTIRDFKFKTLCESVQVNPDYFETRPILCNKDFEIFAGNMRFNAAKEIGMTEVPVAVMDIPKKRQREIMLRDNLQQGEWDWGKLAANFDIDTLLATGFDEVDLTNIWKDLTVEDDSFDELKEIEKAKTTTIKQGDLFALGSHRLLCGNSLDPNVVKKLMGSAKADMVNDDPPFNINLSYEKGVGGRRSYGGKVDDNKSDSEYQKFLETLMQNALAVSKPDAHFLWWCDERYVWMFQSLYKELGLDSKRLCIWIKDNASPTPKVAFNKVTEFCVYGTRGRPFLSDKVTNLNEIINKEVTSGNRLTDDILDLLNIWLVKRLPGNEYQHPTQKNPTLHEKALRRCTRIGDIVLDLTAGSGSIMSACHQLKRKAYLCEQSEIFCQLIINRFKQLASNEKVNKLN